jgi:hypothetical protein
VLPSERIAEKSGNRNKSKLAMKPVNHRVCPGRESDVSVSRIHIWPIMSKLPR